MKILKVSIVLVILFFVVAAPYQVSAQERPSKEEAVAQEQTLEETLRILGNDIKLTEEGISYLDALIEIAQRNKISLVEKRAVLTASRQVLVELSEEITVKGEVSETIGKIAIVTGVALGGPVAVAVGGGGWAIIELLDAAIEVMEKYTERIEEKLEKQKEKKLP